MSDSDVESPHVDPEPSGTPQGAAGKRPPSPWIWVLIAAAVVLVAALLFRGGTVSVPLVVGQTQSEAQALIESAGLRVGQVSDVATLAVPPGTVVQQSPTPETKVRADSAVDITVSGVPKVDVPDVVGQTESAASETLAEQGLRIGNVAYVFDPDVDAGRLTAQDPSASTVVAVGSAIDITVSKGEQQGQVPNVVGLAQSDAESALEGAGFKPKTTKSTSADVPAGDVIDQSPAAGVVAAAGSTVTIKVSTGAPAPVEPTPPATESATPPEETVPQEPAESGTPPAEKPATKPVPKTADVPDVVGMRVIEAIGALRKADLKVKIAWAATDKDVLLVIDQNPAAGTQVDPGTAVTITIGLPSFSFEQPAQQPATEQPEAQPAPAPTPAPAPEPTAGPGAGTVTTPTP